MKNSPIKKLSASINLGDIFALGNHRLAYGDSRDAKLVDKLFGKERASLLLLDPPYGVAYVESKSGFKQKLGKEKIIANDHAQSDEEYRQFTKDWLEPFFHLSDEGARELVELLRVYSPRHYSPNLLDPTFLRELASTPLRPFVVSSE